MYLKWAGGKTKLASQLLPLFPKEHSGAYIEPFFGSGAMYFALRESKSEPDIFESDKFLPTSFAFNDLNPRLINCHLAVQMAVDALEEALRAREESHKKAPRWFYHETRDITFYETLDMSSGCDVERAADFIYLNKSCFNGLWRVNKSGGFNVPWNQQLEVNLVTPALRAAHRYLQDCEFHLGDYDSVCEEAKEGDFVYLDPPYVPLSESSSFTSYTEEGFTEEDLWNLRKLCDHMTRVGIKWCMSNSSSPLVYEAFEGYEITEIDAPRFIKPVSGDEKRETVKETVTVNYDL